MSTSTTARPAGQIVTESMTSRTTEWDATTAEVGSAPRPNQALPWTLSASERRARFAQTLHSIAVADRLEARDSRY